MAIVTAEQQLCDLYNAANPGLPHPLTPDDVTFGSRGPYTPENTEGLEFIPNYALNLTALPDSPHFKENITVHYRRVPTGFMYGGEEHVEGTVEEWNDDEHVLAFLNERTQMQYTRDAFLIDEIVITRTDNDDTLDVNVTINNHIKFIDDGVTWKIVKSATKTDLSTADGELDGFSQ